MIDDAARQRVLAQIDRQELLDLCLRLGNIPSPYRREREAAEYVFGWMDREGFRPRRVGMVEDRFNVVGALPGLGGGKSLIFSSHLDTGRAPDDTWVLRRPQDPFYNTAWIEGDGIVGHGVENDKGPMACFLVAAKAIRAAKVALLGDIVLTACPGEIGQEPVDEFQGVHYLSKEVGVRYLLTHGAVFGDFAIAAEGTDFGVAWVEAGKAFYKVTVYGKIAYTPWVKHPENLVENTNAIVKMSRVIEALEGWARTYPERHAYRCPGGDVIPQVQIGAIRGGYPYYLITGTEVCSLYLDVRTVPGQDPRGVGEEIRAVIGPLGVECDVELTLHRPGSEAKGVEPLVGAVQRAHQAIMDRPMAQAIAPFSSMWRDNIVFNEFAIPSLTYGPPRFTPIAVDDLVRTAQVYALTALDLCGEVR